MARKEKKINCIVKSSESVKRSLLKRISELGLTNAAIIKDAATFGKRIGAGQLSRYLTSAGGQPDNGLTQETILWICTRYCIPVTIAIGSMVKEENGSFRLKMPVYDEEAGKKRVVEKFGRSK